MMAGVALEFETISSPTKLPALIAETTGYSSLPMLIMADAFRESLRSARPGEWDTRIDLRLDHDDSFHLVSTCSGGLVVSADEKALYFSAGGSGDGLFASRYIRMLRGHREVSVGFAPRKVRVLDGVLVVLAATLTEISIVPRGCFPGTSVRFI